MKSQQKKVRVTITIDPALLDEVHDIGGMMQQSNSAALSWLCRLGLQSLNAMKKGGIDHGWIKIYGSVDEGIPEACERS